MLPLARGLPPWGRNGLLCGTTAACTQHARLGPLLQVIYSYILSAIVFHEGMSIVSAAGVLCTLCGVALVVLRHGPTPAAKPVAPNTAQSPAPSSPLDAAASQSLAEQVLSKQASVAQQQAEQIAGAKSGSNGAAPKEARVMTPQRSLRALTSLRRATAEAASSGGAGAVGLVRDLSLAAAAQLSTAPSNTAADLALAADGACGACMAALAASTVAFEAFGVAAAGAGSPGDAAAALQGAAEAVAAAFVGDAAAIDSQAVTAWIPTAMAVVATDGSDPCSVPAGSGAERCSPPADASHSEGPAQIAPRMSSHLSDCLGGAD